MGNLNLLQSGYTKRVGEVYGVKQYGKYIMKAIPFSHTPHNQTQKKCLSAFTALNRFSSALAKQAFYNLPVTDKSMYKNNAVSQWLKSGIKNKTFDPEGFIDVIPDDGSVTITAAEFDPDTCTFSATAQNNQSNIGDKNYNLFLAFFSNTGKTYAIAKSQSNILTRTFSLPLIDFEIAYIMAFKTVSVGKKKKAVGLQLYKNDALYVVNGVWYMSRLPWQTAPTIDNEILSIAPENGRVDGNTLYYQNI